MKHSTPFLSWNCYTASEMYEKLEKEVFCLLLQFLSNLKPGSADVLGFFDSFISGDGEGEGLAKEFLSEVLIFFFYIFLKLSGSTVSQTVTFVWRGQGDHLLG